MRTDGIQAWTVVAGRDSSTLAHDESQLDDEDIGIFTLQDHLNFLVCKEHNRLIPDHN
jgi:hypothetical protein